MMKYIKRIGSLSCAVSLILGLAAILTVSTFIEAYTDNGTAYINSIVYKKNWFNVFLSMMWINIFCATLSRYPYKKRHIGFIITHIGLLTILAGSLVDRMYGIEGQIRLEHGQKTNELLQEGYELRLTSGEQSFSHDLEHVNQNLPYRITEPVNGTITRLYENAVEDIQIVEGTPQDPRRHAITFSLENPDMDTNITDTLLETGESHHGQSIKQVGRVFATIRRVRTTKIITSPTLLITTPDNIEVFFIPLDKPIEKSYRSKDAQWTISQISYFPHAIIQGQSIQSSQDTTKFNPAIQYIITNKNGREERYTHFAFYPMAPHQDVTHFNLYGDLLLPNDQNGYGRMAPALFFTVMPDNTSFYHITSARNPIVSGEVKVGETVQTGWMAFTLTFHNIFNHAQAHSLIRRGEHPSMGEISAYFSATDTSSSAHTGGWILESKPLNMNIQSSQVQLTVGPKTTKLPFELLLHEFRKVDYPGTQEAMSYESDVVLHDNETGQQTQTTISMNEPLDNNGFRIFQSSYLLEPLTSIFSVAYNPGIDLIYSGAIILFSGVIILFFIQPQLLRRKK